jgi:integrase
MASIRRMPQGRWQAIVRRKGYRPQFRTFPSQPDAKQWARQVESEIDRAVFVDRGPSERVTLGELIDRYIGEVLPGKKSRASLTRCLMFLRLHFGVFALAAIQPKDISAYRDARIASGRAGATVVKELNTLSRVIDTAIREWGYFLPANPVKLVGKPAVARGRERRLTDDEEKALFQACRQSRAPMLTEIVQVALETGMRLGELLSLTWTNIDLQRKTAKLRETKNGESRVVPLSSVALKALAGLSRHISNSRVFWRWSRADSFEGAWKRVLRKTGIADLRFHDLRHEAVSRLFERGLNVMEVSAISGHKTMQMLRRYTHLKPEELAQKLA